MHPQQPGPYQQAPYPNYVPGVQPSGGRPSAAPVVVGAVVCVLAGLHALLPLIVVFGGAHGVSQVFPFRSLLMGAVVLGVLVLLFAALAVFGGVMLIRRFAWARFVVLGAAAVLLLDACSGVAMVPGKYWIGSIGYALVWIVVIVLMFVPPVARALRDRRSAAYPPPPQWHGYQPPPQQRW